MKRIPNVLVIDDEKSVCNSCKKILTREGYHVDVASSGEEALNKIKSNGFDVVITDWKMPEMDGIEIANRIKKENPKITVIMITGYPSVDTSVKAMRAGISDYVPKPFTPEELSDAMFRALARGQAVPTDLVIDRLVEKQVVTPKAKPTLAPMPVEGKKVGVLSSVLAPAFSRLFFIALGPIVLYTVVAGIFKLVSKGKSLS